MAFIIKDAEGNDLKHDGKEVWASDRINVIKGVDLAKRTLRITASDESVDRDGDIIMTKGWNFDNYKKNPVFLWAHDYSSVPLAASIKIERKRSPWRIVLTHKFPTKGLNEFADMILSLYDEGMINAGSVGFFPFEREALTEEDLAEHDSKQPYPGFRFLAQELLEHSGCAVPSNPNALQNAVKSAGLKAQWRKNGSIYLDFTPQQRNDIVGEIKEIQARGVEIEEDTAVSVQVPEQLEQVPEDIEQKLEQALALDPDYRIEKEEVEKPFKNEHACRIKDPAQYSRFSRVNCGQRSSGKCIDVIYGIKGDKAQVQALRYKKDVWSKAQAAKHCKSRNGSFEPAAEQQVDAPPALPQRYYDIDSQNLMQYNASIDKWEPVEEDAQTTLTRKFVALFEDVVSNFSDSMSQEVEDYRNQFHKLLKPVVFLKEESKKRLAKEIKQVVTAALTEGVEKGQTAQESKSLLATILEDEPPQATVQPAVAVPAAAVDLKAKIREAKLRKMTRQVQEANAKISKLIKP